MDWNMLLFIAKWAVIGLIYFVLFLLLLGVYGEMSLRLRRTSPAVPVPFGKLKVVHPGKDRRTRLGQLLPLHFETRVGAEPDNELVLEDPFVSGHHALLRWDGATWWVEDLGSQNGTTIDQQPVYPRQPQPLRSGARLGIGDMIFELLD